MGWQREAMQEMLVHYLPVLSPTSHASSAKPDNLIQCCLLLPCVFHDKLMSEGSDFLRAYKKIHFHLISDCKERLSEETTQKITCAIA